jgi:hypothetical protein
MPTWTTEDQERALADGWGIFRNDPRAVRIAAYDDADEFTDDAEAEQHVLEAARWGDALAAKALHYLAYAAPRYHVMLTCGADGAA